MISLRSLVIEDSKRIFELASNWEVAKSTLGLPHPYPEDGAKPWVEDTLNNIKLGTNYVQAITHNNSLIGVIGVLDIEDSKGELGYWIGEDYWGKGFCSNALTLFMTKLTENTNLKSIYAHCFQSNPASKKVLSKISLTASSQQRIVNREQNPDILIRFEGAI